MFRFETYEVRQLIFLSSVVLNCRIVGLLREHPLENRRTYATSGPVVTLQLVPLAGATPLCCPVVLYPSRKRGFEALEKQATRRPEETKREREREREKGCSRRGTCGEGVVQTPRFSPLQTAHAMINITPQSYGIQTDLETDFFLFRASRRPKGKCNFRDESSIEIGSQKLEGWLRRGGG